MSTANPQRGEVEITLDKPRILRLTTNSIVRAEEILGVSLLNENPRAFGFKEARALLFVGLNDRKLTLEKVGELMDGAEDSVVLGAVTKAWVLHLYRHEKPSEPAEVAEEPVDPPTAAGLGTGS